MTDIKWDDPPAKATGRSEPKHAEFADQLRANPMKWAVFSENAFSNSVTQINKGGLAAFRPSGHFEARGQTVAANRSKVWVRYVGEQA